MPDTPSPRSQTLNESPTPNESRTSQGPAAPSRRERRKLEIRSRIYGVARDLFTKQGFEATTVDEIARVADVAPATFFNHFHSKQALLGLMTGEVFEYLHAMTSEHLEREGSADEKLRAFISSATEGIAASRGVARDVLLEFMRIDATPNGPHPYLERLFEPFVRLIKEGQSEGVMRDDHDANFLAQMAVGMMNSAITNWLADPEYAVEAGLMEAAEFALATLAPRSTSSTSLSAKATVSLTNETQGNL